MVKKLRLITTSLKGYSREQHYQKKAKDLATDRESIAEKTQTLDKRIQDAELVINDELAKLDSEDMLVLKKTTQSST